MSLQLKLVNLWWPSFISSNLEAGPCYIIDLATLFNINTGFALGYGCESVSYEIRRDISL